MSELRGSIQSDIEKLNAALRETDSSTDSDSDEDEVLSSQISVPTQPTNQLPREDDLNIDFNDVTPYPTQIETITSQIKTLDIHKVLLLNRTQYVLLQRIRRKYENILEQCNQNLIKIRHYINTFLVDKYAPNNRSIGYLRLGIPYFKDLRRNYCGGNPDALDKRANGRITLVDLPITRYWIEKEKVRLRNIVLEQSGLIRLQVAKDRARGVVVPYDDGRSYSDNMDKNAFPVEFKDVPIDWLQIAAQEFEGRHTYEECKALWYLYLHPGLNNKPFDKKEFSQLQAIAEKYRFQNWDAIAKELGTKRSGYFCFLYYRLNKIEKRQQRKWTPEDDVMLLEVIERCKMGDYIPWSKVSYYIKDRSKAQVYVHYYNTLCDKLKKGRFTEQEDILISALVQKIGTNFSRISSYIPGRTSTQIRQRYLLHASYYQQKLEGNNRVFTPEEDKQIHDHVQAHGTKSWSQLEKNFKSEIKRSRTTLRHRWRVIQKHLKDNGDLSTVPTLKRKQKILSVPQGPVVELMLNIDKFEKAETADIIEVILEGDRKTKHLENFKHKFISLYHFKGRSENLTEVDYVNSIVLLTILGGRLIEDFDMNLNYPAAIKDGLTILDQIVVNMKHNSNQRFIDFVSKYWTTSYATPFIKTSRAELLGQIFATKLLDDDVFRRALSCMKLIMRRLCFLPSDLDLFYTQKNSKYVITDAYKHPLPEQLETIERKILDEINNLTCKDVLEGNSEIYSPVKLLLKSKLRILSLFLLPNMIWVGVKLLELWENYELDGTPKPKTPVEKEKKPVGRPYKKRKYNFGEKPVPNKDDKQKGVKRRKIQTDQEKEDDVTWLRSSQRVQEFLLKKNTMDMNQLSSNSSESNVCDTIVKVEHPVLAVIKVERGSEVEDPVQQVFMNETEITEEHSMEPSGGVN